MSGQEVRPGRWYYGLAGAVFISGWLLFGLFLFRNLSRISSGLHQVVVPGKTGLSLSRPGSYTIYYEYESVVGSKVYSSSRSLSGLECTVASKATGQEVTLSRTAVSSRYSVGGRSGYSVFGFKIDRPGIYEISAQYPEGQEGPEVVLAVGQGFTMRVLTTVFGGLAIVFGSIGLSVAIAVYTAVKRHKALRQAQDRYEG